MSKKSIYLLLSLILILLFDCKSDNDVLATYESPKKKINTINRGTLNEIYKVFNIQDGTIAFQKKLLSDFVVTTLLSQKAIKEQLDKSEKLQILKKVLNFLTLNEYYGTEYTQNIKDALYELQILSLPKEDYSWEKIALEYDKMSKNTDHFNALLEKYQNSKIDSLWSFYSLALLPDQSRPFLECLASKLFKNKAIVRVKNCSIVKLKKAVKHLYKNPDLKSQKITIDTKYDQYVVINSKNTDSNFYQVYLSDLQNAYIPKGELEKSSVNLLSPPLYLEGRWVVFKLVDTKLVTKNQFIKHFLKEKQFKLHNVIKLWDEYIVRRYREIEFKDTLEKYEIQTLNDINFTKTPITTKQTKQGDADFFIISPSLKIPKALWEDYMAYHKTFNATLNKFSKQVMTDNLFRKFIYENIIHLKATKLKLLEKKAFQTLYNWKLKTYLAESYKDKFWYNNINISDSELSLEIKKQKDVLRKQKKTIHLAHIKSDAHKNLLYKYKTDILKTKREDLKKIVKFKIVHDELEKKEIID